MGELVDKLRRALALVETAQDRRAGIDALGMLWEERAFYEEADRLEAEAAALLREMVGRDGEEADDDGER